MDASLATVKLAIERFEKVVAESEEFSEVLAAEYNRARRSLAVGFQGMALEATPRNEFRLDDVKRDVVARMRDLFGGRVDSSLFRVSGYTTPHPHIYALLASQTEVEMPAWRIRLVTADATHTERRTRELRDLGLDVVTHEDNGESLYRLTSLAPDLTYGAAFQLRRNALKSRAMSERSRLDVVDLAEATADLPPRKESE